MDSPGEPAVPDASALAPALLSSRPIPVWIHPSRWLEAVAAQRSGALAAGAVPHTFHYEGWHQSRLWTEVAAKYQPPGLEAFYRGAFGELAASGLPSGAIHLVGLGAGGARKERWLLETMPERQRAGFTPVDVSATLALESARHAHDLLTVPIRPLVADIDQLTDLAGWLDETAGADPPRWFTAFGLTPNSPPGRLLPRLRGFLRPADRLLVSANLLPGSGIEGVRSEYDNPATHRWLRQVLIDWGLDHLLGHARFEAGRLDGADALVAWVRWEQDAGFDWDGQLFQARRGQALRLFFTIRYAMPDFVAALEGAGLAVERNWQSACCKEGLCLVRAC